jgi:hypothetical protein
MKLHCREESINGETKRVPTAPYLLQIPHWLSRVQTRASVLRGEWLRVSLQEQINYFLGFECNDVTMTTKVLNSPFPRWKTSISKEWAERLKECALSYGYCMCLLFGARNVFTKRSLESGTSRTYVASVFSIIARSHACRAVHRLSMPKHTKWVEVIFLSLNPLKYQHCQMPYLLLIHNQTACTANAKENVSV